MISSISRSALFGRFAPRCGTCCFAPNICWLLPSDRPGRGGPAGCRRGSNTSTGRHVELVTAPRANRRSQGRTNGDVRHPTVSTNERSGFGPDVAARMPRRSGSQAAKGKSPAEHPAVLRLRTSPAGFIGHRNCPFVVTPRCRVQGRPKNGGTGQVFWREVTRAKPGKRGLAIFRAAGRASTSHGLVSGAANGAPNRERWRAAVSSRPRRVSPVDCHPAYTQLKKIS